MIYLLYRKKDGARPGRGDNYEINSGIAENWESGGHIHAESERVHSRCPVLGG